MPIGPTTPKFPLHEHLARFFTTDRRRRVPLSHVAELLGITTGMFRSMLAGEGGRRRSDTLPWAEAAAYLFDAWPRAQLLDALGPDHASRVPAGFHPTRVSWSIPIGSGAGSTRSDGPRASGGPARPAALVGLA
jgi:hypothetical protein